VIEATEEPDFFSCYSTDREGFSGVGHSVEDCLCKAKWGMVEHVSLLEEQGLPPALRQAGGISARHLGPLPLRFCPGSPSGILAPFGHRLSLCQKGICNRTCKSRNFNDQFYHARLCQKHRISARVGPSPKTTFHSR
jgi:hypothetical protein